MKLFDQKIAIKLLREMFRDCSMNCEGGFSGNNKKFFRGGEEVITDMKY